MTNWDNLKKFKKYNYDIWVNTPKNHYIITTDQQIFYVDRYNLDYKKTVANLKKAGYTNINIAHIGKNTTF